MSMFSAPEGVKWFYSEATKTLLVIWEGFSDMIFAERYLRVISRRKGPKDVQVIAVTPEEYEKYKKRIDELI